MNAVKDIRRRRQHVHNIILPTLVYGGITGIVTGLVVVLYKLCAAYAIGWSQSLYQFMRNHPLSILAALSIVTLAAYAYACVFKRIPSLRGGGIPTAIGSVRGVLSMKWLSNCIGVFVMSLSTFIIGVPLGNEGPAVQMGAALGKGTARCASRDKNCPWTRYSMTGGACAAFAIATGAPLAGVLFAVEEAHQRITPLIIIMSFTSVISAYIVSQVLCPLIGISAALLPKIELSVMPGSYYWIPVVVGVAAGLFSTLFLKLYTIINRLLTVRLKLPAFAGIAIVFALTLAVGIWSSDYISTGHDLIVSLIDGRRMIGVLLLIFVIRSLLTVSANCTGVTGGMFLPILTLGAVISAAVGELCVGYLNVPAHYYQLILVLGIAGSLSGMMKIPITAIVFVVEAMNGASNLFAVIIVSAVSYFVTEIFATKSINDIVIKARMRGIYDDKSMTREDIDTFVTVREGSFAVGKQIRDILWPSNLFVLSVKRLNNNNADVDEHGDKTLRAGDTLHIRYSTYDCEATGRELAALIGPQTEADAADAST